MKKEKPADKASTEETKELATVNSQVAIPSDIADLISEDQGAGQENIGIRDLTIPRIQVIQALSPQLDKNQLDKYLEDAEVGMFADLALGRLWDGGEGIAIIPAHYRFTHLEWWPRGAKGGRGFIADLGPDETVLRSTKKDDKGRNITEKGSEIIATAEYFVLVVDKDGSASPYVLSMNKTQLRKSRNWNTMMNQLQVPHPKGGGSINPAIFYRSYDFTTVPESNEHGNWMGIKIVPGKFTLEFPNGKDLYLKARAFRESVVEGKVQASKPHEDADSTSGGPSNVDDNSPM